MGNKRRGGEIGRAIELVAGEPHQALCYGTYAGDMPDQSFRFRISFVEHPDNFRMHSHEYSELVVVLGGRAMHLTEFENHPLETGDAFVINGGARHGFEKPQGLKLCNLMFDPRQFLNDQRDLDTLMGYHALFHLAPRSPGPRAFKERLHLSAVEMEPVSALISSMKTEFDGRAEGWRTVVRSQFLLLATHLSRLYGRHKQRQLTPLVRMARVVSHVRREFHQPLRVEDLAAMACLSVSQFQRRFKSIYQTTPIKFINQVRLQAACDQLRDPNRQVTQVAMECGFASGAFFSSQFKATMGESPSAYRRRHLEPVAGGGASPELQ